MSTPYHRISRNQRDHLLAVALLAEEQDTLPAQAHVGDRVSDLRGDTPPSRNTTSNALQALEVHGYVSRVDGKPTADAKGVRLTDRGREVIESGAHVLQQVVDDSE